jgi:hypothetical protein
MARRIDGVIALLPAGADPHAPALAAALRAGYQDRLLGTVGQAA